METQLNLRLVLVLAAAALSASPAFAQQPPPPPMISVSGAAEVKVAPDEIHLRLGVETRHESLETAKSQNDERVARTLAFLKASQVKTKDVQTDFLNIEPSYDNNFSRTKPVTFVVRKAIQVKLTGTGGFEGLLTGLLTNGVSHVHDIEFRTSQLRKHRDTARALAIRAAKEKAGALTSEIGVKCGKVYSINANDWGGWWSSSGSYWGGRYGGGMHQNVIQSAGGGAPTEDGALSVGQISVSATVNVSFLIE